MQKNLQLGLRLANMLGMNKAAKQTKQYYWIELEVDCCEYKRKRFDTYEARVEFVNEYVAKGFRKGILVNTNADVVTLRQPIVEVEYADDLVFDDEE